MQKKVAAYFGIGSGGNANTANIQWNIAELGWGNFINNAVAPLLHLNWRDIWLHNPFGAWNNPMYDGRNVMQFDQWLEVQENTDAHGNLERVTTSFANSWGFILNYVPDLNVTAYLGKLPDDPDFEQFIDDDRLHLWFERFTQAVSPLLEVGMNVGLDAIATPNVNDEHYAYGAAVMLKSLLNRTEKELYVEPLSMIGGEHWHKFPSMSTTAHMRVIERNQPGAIDSFLASNNQRHCIVLNHRTNGGTYIDGLKPFVDRGFFPLYHGYKALNGDETYEQVEAALGLNVDSTNEGGGNSEVGSTKQNTDASSIHQKRLF